MISLYGPFTITAGTLISESVDQMATNLRVTNDSPYDVWVIFQPSRPGIPSNGQSAGSYSQVCQAWSSQVFPISPPNPNTSFDGTVWLYPVNYGNLAASGTISARAQVYLTAGQAGDDLGTNHAVSRQADMTSQPRVIALPSNPKITVYVIGTIAPANYGNSANAVYTQVINKPGGGWSGGAYTIYLYDFALGLLNEAVAAVVVFIGATISSILVSKLAAWTGLLRAGQTFRSNPASPIAIQLTPDSSWSDIGVGAYILTGINGTTDTASASNPARLALWGRGDVDTLGQAPPPAIGQGAGTPPGVIY